MDGVGTGFEVSFFDRVPLCLRALIGDTCQTFATGERILAYARDAVPDRDACQTGAIAERITAYTRGTIRDRDACQIGATGERTLIDFRNII